MLIACGTHVPQWVLDCRERVTASESSHRRAVTFHPVRTDCCVPAWPPAPRRPAPIASIVRPKALESVPRLALVYSAGLIPVSD
eukprot:COSAG02_NODE_32550_length_514_cov_1.600000_1_plen_83_part_01